MMKISANIASFPQIPELTTEKAGPLLHLEEQLLQKHLTIECWMREQWEKTPPNIYCSVDLRNAGFKLSPVDTNLFPAGFNNLSQEVMPLCIQAAQTVINSIIPECKNILLLPETHSQNPFYWESLASLRSILVKAGYQVRVGFLDGVLKEPREINLPSKQTILLEPTLRKADQLGVAGFDPCLIMLNNDLSTGVPEILQNLSQPICPQPKLGWEARLKSEHFKYYRTICAEFADLTGIDPWLICPLFNKCGEVDFATREGEACVMAHAQAIIQQIKDKYKQYEVAHKPFIVVKADAGTYGMGVMMIEDPQEIRQLSRRQRNRMKMTKGKQKLNKVIIQEGVYTFESWENAVAEPVVYLIGQYVVGGFYRVHTGRGRADNLNAPGMHFEPLAFTQPCNNPEEALSPTYAANQFYSYGVIARLAALAAARELASLGTCTK